MIIGQYLMNRMNWQMNLIVHRIGYAIHYDGEEGGKPVMLNISTFFKKSKRNNSNVILT